MIVELTTCPAGHFAERITYSDGTSYVRGPSGFDCGCRLVANRRRQAAPDSIEDRYFGAGHEPHTEIEWALAEPPWRPWPGMES